MGGLAASSAAATVARREGHASAADRAVGARRQSFGGAGARSVGCRMVGCSRRPVEADMGHKETHVSENRTALPASAVHPRTGMADPTRRPLPSLAETGTATSAWTSREGFASPQDCPYAEANTLTRAVKAVRLRVSKTGFESGQQRQLGAERSTVPQHHDPVGSATPAHASANPLQLRPQPVRPATHIRRSRTAKRPAARRRRKVP
jgi:hypothetical protein